MNERILLLAEQAGLEYDFNPMLWLKYEKFAELIVNECVDYCGENLSKTVGGALKIHFGVDQ